MLKLGLEPEMDVIEGPVVNFNEREVYWIAEYKRRGFRLTNSTAGGEGLKDAASDVRAKIGKSSTERLTKYWSDPAYKKRVGKSISTSHSTPEYRKKLSDDAKRRWANPEFKARVAATISKTMLDKSGVPEYEQLRRAHVKKMKVKMGSEEMRGRLSQKGKESWARKTDKEKQKTIKAMHTPVAMQLAKKKLVGIRSTLEFKQKISVSVRERNADPAFKQKMKRVRATPEFKAAVAKGAKRHAAMYADSKYREWHGQCVREGMAKGRKS